MPEPDSVTTPPEPIKEKRRKSRSSSVKELDESKSFALFGDWQPRRSERIFINSSVAPPSSADLSPLSSPTVKTSDLGWPKKTKRLSKGKKVGTFIDCLLACLFVSLLVCLLVLLPYVVTSLLA